MAGRVTTLLVLAAFFASGAFTPASANDDLHIGVFLATGRQTGSPVLLEGFEVRKEAHQSAPHPTVVFRNNSSKEIRNIIIVALVGNAADRSSGGIEVENKGPLQVTVAPGAIGKYKDEANPRFPNSDALMGLAARRWRTNCLFVLALVSDVEFADGTTWKSEFLDRQRMWQDSVSPESKAFCDNSPLTQAAFKRWDGTTKYVVGANRPEPTAKGQFFFSCSIRKDDTVAECPF